MTQATDSTLQFKFVSSRILIYGALLLWAFVCLFPIYWTINHFLQNGRECDAR